MFTKSCSFTLLLPKCDAVVLGNSRLTTMLRLPEDRNLKQQRCENLNTVIAAWRFILYSYLCKFIPYLKWKIQLRKICVFIVDVVQILFLLTPHFSQTGCRPVIWETGLFQRPQQIKILSPLFLPDEGNMFFYTLWS